MLVLLHSAEVLLVLLSGYLIFVYYLLVAFVELAEFSEFSL